jgi:hypothetical protein
MVALAAARQPRYIIWAGNFFHKAQYTPSAKFGLEAPECGRFCLRPVGLAATWNWGYIMAGVGMYPAERMHPIPMKIHLISAEASELPPPIGDFPQW